MDLNLIPLLTLFLFILSVIYIFFHHQSKDKPTRGFKHYPLVGTLPSFLNNRHRFLEWSTSVLSFSPTNTAVFRRPGGVHGVITANPAVVEHILKTKFTNYPKGERFIALLEDFLGDGIFNSDGELWRLQRKTASYEFSKKSLRDFVGDCVRCEIRDRFLPLMIEAAGTGEVLDLQDVLERFAFDNVCKLAFNVDPHCLTSSRTIQPEFMRAFDQATICSTGRFLTALPILWKIRKFLNIGSERTLGKSVRIVHEFADNIIKQRLDDQEKKLTDQASHKNHNNNTTTSSPHHEDLLSRFIDSHNNQSMINSPKLLRDVVVSFILAGRDTTSSALTWFFWLISSHPEILKKIRSEIDYVRTANAGKRVGEESDDNVLFSYEEIQKMNYLHAAVSESMRLYPPVPVDTKTSMDDDVLPDGTELKKGWFVTYHTYAMGRMEAIWGKDCMEFKPERWLDDEGFKMESPFKYPVFHAGPRVCLGKEMAFIQMKSIVASLVERFDVEVVGMKKEKEKGYVLAMTMRMKGGLPVKVKQTPSV